MSVEKIAPRGKFRVIAVDVNDKTEWVHRDCNSQEEAFKAAKERQSTRIQTHIYDDCGEYLKPE